MLPMASVPNLNERDLQAIQRLCQQIADGLQAAGGCPCCSASLQAKVNLEAVDVTCPSGCFRFSYRRDPLTGAFVSGSLDFPGQNSTIATGPVQTTPIEGPRTPD